MLGKNLFSTFLQTLHLLYSFSVWNSESEDKRPSLKENRILQCLGPWIFYFLLKSNDRSLVGGLAVWKSEIEPGSHPLCLRSVQRSQGCFNPSTRFHKQWPVDPQIEKLLFRIILLILQKYKRLSPSAPFCLKKWQIMAFEWR